MSKNIINLKFHFQFARERPSLGCKCSVCAKNFLIVQCVDEGGWPLIDDAANAFEMNTLNKRDSNKKAKKMPGITSVR